MINWKKIKLLKNNSIKNDLSKGTFHLDKEFKKYDKINLKKKYFPLELINHIRAKTFPPHDGVYFTYKGKKIYCTINLVEKKS